MRKSEILRLLIAAVAVAGLATMMALMGPPTKDLGTAAIDGDLWQIRRNIAWCGGPDRKESVSFALFEAMTHEQWDACKLLIESGADVTQQERVYYENGRTALHYAAGVGRTDLVNMLIAHGADVNATAGFGATPLHDAALAGRNGAVEALLAHGAKIDAFCCYANEGTPLYLAVKAGWTDTADLLLAKGASVNAVGNNGLTLLDLAVWNNDLRVAEWLVSKGADLSPKTPDVWAPLQVAAWNETKPEMVALLLARGAKIDIFSACGLGRVDRVRELLDGDPKLADARTSSDKLSPLDCAYRKRHADVARLLIERGEKADLSTAAWLGMHDKVAAILDDGSDVLYSSACAKAMDEAAASGHVKVVEVMLSRGFKLRENSRSLIWAAEAKQTVVVKLLLAKGADVNGGTTTALHWAAHNGDIEMAKLLLAHGADVNATEQPESDKTPLDRAVAGGHKEMVKLLIKAGAELRKDVDYSGCSLDLFLEQWLAKGRDRKSLDAALAVAVEQHKPDDVKKLLDLGADVNARDNWHRWPLWFADAKTTELLLSRGAKVDYRSACRLGMADRVEAFVSAHPELIDIGERGESYDGEQPLLFAIGGGYADIVKMLLARGAKPTSAALERAVAAGGKDIVAILLDAGADFGPVATRGQSPLEQAPDAVRGEIASMIQAERAKREQARAGQSGPMSQEKFARVCLLGLWLPMCLGLAVHQWRVLRQARKFERRRGVYWSIITACRVFFLVFFLLAGALLALSCR